ncbi:Leucine carboxyl methyltransferase [Amycolatopsis australiensis]|uniref:Leucine carboxyl methyltransferase n=1 Tax=Amycolatopsis australiensis TaxID=546364 RepID=A0A1K1R087_9PSEU|nr:class I SAM-dependent methyltransferase [Amycolatopsis australiensis]SFW64982.1 Leucine carboxyl methyltransferase [Amycolatopsis australiensis]
MPSQLRLGPVQETLLLTLYARALDSKAPTPILGDTMAATVADRIAEDTGYDFAKLKLKPSLIAGTALRARKLDDVIRQFLATHPGAVVVDLGCGLDTRSARCAPPDHVDWYDVDFPEVTDLRRRYLPDRSHLVPADVTDPGWVQALPAARPAMIVADGLLPFLPGDSFQAMIRRLTTPRKRPRSRNPCARSPGSWPAAPRCPAKARASCTTDSEPGRPGHRAGRLRIVPGPAGQRDRGDPHRTGRLGLAADDLPPVRADAPSRPRRRAAAGDHGAELREPRSARVSVLDAVAVRDDDGVAIFAVNRDQQEPNTGANPARVVPRTGESRPVGGGELVITLPRLSGSLSRGPHVVQVSPVSGWASPVTTAPHVVVAPGASVPL